MYAYVCVCVCVCVGVGVLYGAVDGIVVNLGAQSCFSVKPIQGSIYPNSVQH